jgi:GT2 family glycosyltransferase
MRERSPIVSIVMVAVGGGWPWVPRALEALRRNTASAYEVILVDNGGAEDRSVPDGTRVEIIRNQENVGFGPGSNQGAARARSDIVCLLNTDVLVEPGWLPPLLELVQDSSVGAAFPAKLNIDGTMQEAGAFVTGDANAYVFGDGDDPDSPEYGFPREVDFGSAAGMCMTRRCYESAGGFDPAYRIAYFEDADLCFRLREQGLRLVYEPRSRVLHARSVSAPPSELADTYSANRKVFLSRWRAMIEQRPVFDELRADARLRCAARDLHAHDRVLLLGAADATLRLARDLAMKHPGARVTLLAEEIDRLAERALLWSGVEVVRSERAQDWLVERTGHYSHVVSPQDGEWLGLREALCETQPQAVFVDAASVEGATPGALVTANGGCSTPA